MQTTHDAAPAFGNLPYLLNSPRQGAAAHRNSALILSLHGRGLCGDDPAQLRSEGLPLHVEQTSTFDHFVLAPQCPAGDDWTPHLGAVQTLLEHIISTHAVDHGRITLTGLSMGGRGALRLLLHMPNTFAAAAIICGRYDGDWAALPQLAHLPLWFFHGLQDPVVPFSETIRIVDTLRATGRAPRLTLYPQADHDAWTATYANPALYSWLLDQRLGSRASF